MERLNSATKLGARFNLLRVLGRGGMGEVWLARDLDLEEEVALKILRPEFLASAAAVESLRVECRLARRLAHPNIVRLFDLHRTDDRMFISMEYVDGGDLRQLRQSDWQRVLAVTLPVADALIYAHAQGVVHRDLKPSNVLLDEHGLPRLADFGVGAVAGDTMRSTAGGSPYTMSPQQLAGQPPTSADDIYGFGVLLHEMLYGRPPSGLGSSLARDPRFAVAAPLPGALGDLLDTMLARQVEGRPANMVTVRNGLAAVLEDTQNLTLPAQAMPKSAAGIPPSVDAIRPVPPTVVLPRTVLAEKGDKPRTVALVLGMLFLGLLAMGAGVFLYLPRMVAEQSEISPAVITRPIPKSEAALPAEVELQIAEIDPAVLREQREAAEEALRELTELRERLEARAVREWATEDYEVAMAEAEQADQWFLERQFEQATTAYLGVVASLGAIEKRVAEVLAHTLEQGDLALASGHAVAALAAFGLALRLEPGHEAARQGLARAQTLDQVRELLAQGRNHVRSGDLDLAAASYAGALKLDPVSVAVQEALAAVQARIQDREFSVAMSKGLNALSAEDLQTARSAFSRAGELKPDAPELTDGLARLGRRVRLQRIGSLKTRAGALEAKGRWAEAERLYSDALTLDPTLVFAREGSLRSGRFARISQGMDGFLADPTRLYSRDPREQARLLVTEARKQAGLPASLEDKAGRLQQQVEIAAKPITVDLLSDNQTEITVFRIGRLGRFERRQLQLPPGTYTVLGSRSGYRDVRRTVTVRPGDRQQPVMVRCEEPV